MAEGTAMPWMPSTKTFIASAIRKLVDEGEQRKACVLLVRQACAGHFGVLVDTLTEMSEFKRDGVKILLSEQAVGSYALCYAFSSTGISEDLYPVFAVAVDLAREARKAKGKALGKKAQGFLLKKVLETPDVKALQLPRAFIDQLFQDVEQVSEQELAEFIQPDDPPPDTENGFNGDNSSPEPNGAGGDQAEPESGGG